MALDGRRTNAEESKVAAAPTGPQGPRPPPQPTRRTARMMSSYSSPAEWLDNCRGNCRVDRATEAKTCTFRANDGGGSFLILRPAHSSQGMTAGLGLGLGGEG
eukprot:scaffold71344_cov34-Phaeocystis_antarctica.AAC.1